jgi:type II secretory pathway component PulC
MPESFMRHASILTSMAIFMAVALPGMTFYEVMQTVRRTSYGDAKAATANDANENKEQSIPSLAAAAGVHLFGAAAVSADVAAHETTLAIELKGVTQSDDAPVRGAVIASEGTEKFFRVGDALPGGAVLTEVYRDWVAMEHNGVKEQLGLKRPQNIGFVASE